MFAVPKDTKLLIFTLPLDFSGDPKKMEPFEHMLTQRTGIPCVVLEGTYSGKFLGGCDFEIRWDLPKEAKEPVEKSGIVLDKKPKDECAQGDSSLHDRDPVHTFRGMGLSSLKFQILPFLTFFLGLLSAHFLKL